MTTKPLSDKAIDHLQALSTQSKAALIPALVAASQAGDTRANYATNMLFAPAGFRPADIVPGIIAANHCGEWINEEISSGTDLDWLEHEKTCEGIKETGYCDCEMSQGQTLIGDWHEVERWMLHGKEVKPRTKGSKKKTIWEINKDGPEGYAATWFGGEYSTGDIMVEWSKWVYFGGRWCSPCNPGQASIPHGDTSFDPGTDGVACYLLPPGLHLCFECNIFGREVVHATDFYGAMLCNVCCERHGIDFKTGKTREIAS